MTEADWIRCTEPRPMLEFLLSGRCAGEFEHAIGPIEFGSGFAGLGAAIKLKEAGVSDAVLDYTVHEPEGVGGGEALLELTEPIALDREAFQADNLHPVAAAQPRLLDHVWAALEPLL